MANTWFQFKQFSVTQERSGMKVSTDACIFGAWLSQIWKNNVGSFLDVGTGTGLLSLMLLQENCSVKILALEPERNAFEEAVGNFRNCPWMVRVSVENKRLQDFESEGKKFDTVFCNPPFFQNQLQAIDSRRNAARHDALSMKDLAVYAIKLTNADGMLAVLYPDSEWERWRSVAAGHGWIPERTLKIIPIAGRTPNRICGIFKKAKETISTVDESLVIRKADGNYSPEFVELLRPFYLYF